MDCRRKEEKKKETNKEREEGKKIYKERVEV
jgi:hypothetical protein